MPETNNWIPVLSSAQITAYRYDAATKQLDIQFPKAKPGEFYRYYNVPKETFDAFTAAESKGKYFTANIKKSEFKYEKLTEKIDGETEVQA